MIGMLERRERGKKPSRVRHGCARHQDRHHARDRVGHVERRAELYSDEAGKRWEMPNEFGEHDMVNHTLRPT